MTARLIEKETFLIELILFLYLMLDVHVVSYEGDDFNSDLNLQNL